MLPLTDGDVPRAAALASRLHVPILAAGPVASADASVSAVVCVECGRVSLQRTGAGVAGPVSVDFGSGSMRHRRRSGGHEMLGRAVGVGKKSAMRVMDATAGLGRDAFVLADLGCSVLLCERHPVLAEMLSSGLQVATTGGDPWLESVCARMQVYALDARDLAPQLASGVDVIYLDPMYGQHRRRAAPGKEMALLQELLGESAPGDDVALLAWALEQAPARVVVKRAPRAPTLGDIEPSHCIAGKAVRYDVHVLRALT